MTLFLAIIQHPVRSSRCWPSINQQTAQTIRAEYPFFSQLHNQILIDAQEIDATHVGIWQDDVAIYDNDYLKKLVDATAEPRTCAGLPAWAQKTGYPQRVWVFNTKDLKPLNFTPKQHDLDLQWQTEQGFTPQIVYTNYDHWIPIQLTQYIHSYVMECWEGKTHWIDENQRLNLELKNYHIHAELKKFAKPSDRR